MRARLALLLLLAATAARGEENCGRMDRYSTPILGPPGVPEARLVWLKCDGKFRRFEELLPAAADNPEIYDGWIEVGHVYRATTIGRRLDPTVSMPRHHMGGISWKNAEGLLPEDEERRVVVFEVTTQWIQHESRGQWVNVLGAEILRVEAAPRDPRVMPEH